jgi:hypothetical protein
MFYQVRNSAQLLPHSLPCSFPMYPFIVLLQTWSIKNPNVPAPPISDAVKNHLGGAAGMYRGVCSTLLRDIPFSMMFFSMHGVIQVCRSGRRSR